MVPLVDLGNNVEFRLDTFRDLIARLSCISCANSPSFDSGYIQAHRNNRGLFLVSWCSDFCHVHDPFFQFQSRAITPLMKMDKYKKLCQPSHQ